MFCFAARSLKTVCNVNSLKKKFEMLKELANDHLLYDRELLHIHEHDEWQTEW